MSNKEFSWASLFGDFQARHIDISELETIIKDAIKHEAPNDIIKELNYHEDGAEVILESGNIIEIAIDWQEIILG